MKRDPPYVSSALQCEQRQAELSLARSKPTTPVEISSIASESGFLPLRISATSLTLAGVPRPRRAKVIGRAVSRIESWFTAWDAVSADTQALDQLLKAYRDRCISIGSELTVAGPDGTQLQGRGAGIGPHGELLVDTGEKVVPVVVGDVVHVSAD